MGLHKAKIIFISVRRAAVILGLLSLNAFAEGSKTGGELILLFSASCDLFASVFSALYRLKTERVTRLMLGFIRVIKRVFGDRATPVGANEESTRVHPTLGLRG